MAVVVKIVPKNINPSKLDEEIIGAGLPLQTANFMGFDRISERQLSPSAAPKNFSGDMAAIGEIRFQFIQQLALEDDATLDAVLSNHNHTVLTAEQQREDQDAQDFNDLLGPARDAYVANLQGWDTMTTADKIDATKQNFVVIGKVMRLFLRIMKRAEI